MPDGLAKRVKSQSSPLNKYFRISCLQCSLLRTHLLLLRSENLFTLRGGVAETYPILFQNRRVQKSPFLCVNRIPIKYGFLFCASAIRYSVNHSRPQSPSFLGHNKLSRVALGTRMSVNITLLQNRRYLSLFFRGARASSRRAWSDSRPPRAFFAQKNKKIMVVLYTTEHVALSKNVRCLW